MSTETNERSAGFLISCQGQFRVLSIENKVPRTRKLDIGGRYLYHQYIYGGFRAEICLREVVSFPFPLTTGAVVVVLPICHLVFGG